MKKRLDLLLVERGFAQSRQRAQSLIMQGNILIGDQPILKPGQLVAADASIRVRGQQHGFVSRGALKLLAAIEAFSISVEGRTALDIGASTGGFTEVLLTRGALQVVAVDVGHNQMDWKIRTDPRVKLYEKINARYLEFNLVGARVDIIVVDVSFISLDKILPALLKFSVPQKTDWITLIKPQFEVGREKVGRGGIVSSDEDRLQAVERVTASARALGLVRKGLIDSPITGTDGNRELLAWWQTEER